MLQIQSTEYRHLTTAHLAQTMSLLGLTVSELRQKIETELAKNPALELIEERRCPQCRRKLASLGPCPICSQPNHSNPEEPIIFFSERQDSYAQKWRSNGEELPDDNFAPATQDLPTFVMRQVAPELSPADRPIAAQILTSLDEDGLLPVPLVEIAKYNHVPLDRVIAILALIQRAEPIGVGSPTPQDALLVQVQVLRESRQLPDLTESVIKEGMEYLSRRQYGELARLLHTSVHQVEYIARFISENLNPYPGRAYWGDIHQGIDTTPDVYTSPDIVIRLLDENDQESAIVAEIMMPVSGTLRVNPLFRNALKMASEDKIDEWRNDLDQANLLVKCLQQRFHTIRRLVHQLVIRQRAFIIKGDAYLIPMTRASLADELGVHESTISRAVANKSVQIPNGHIIPLERFFDRSLQVRTVLRTIISQEVKPLSDTQLAAHLRDHGFEVARRTVAKYRAMEGILPARLRYKSGSLCEVIR